MSMAILSSSFLTPKMAIYGVDGVGQSDPTLVRTDAALGLTYSVGASEITSDFDHCYPWSDIEEFTDAYDNVFVKIPKFYTKITASGNGTYKHQISGCKYEGFKTLFVDGKGNELDYILVGKYEGSYNSTNSRMMSKSGQTVKVNITLPDYRTACKAVGDGYQQYDFLIDAIIKELFMIEFATTNSQSIMMGYTNSSNAAALNTGHTDNVSTSSGSEISNTDGKHACKYRGIENPFGNVWKWCDGINFNNEKIYVCENPSEYAPDKYTSPYIYMGDRVMKNGHAKTITPFVKNPLLGYTTAVGGSNSTYYCDYYYQSTAGTVLVCGGTWSDDSYAGLWYWLGGTVSSDARASFGGRLCYKPL